MPVTVVVGGQFGSEGKGKVAHFLAQEKGAKLAIRVGGTNSGHTVINPCGAPMIFRQLPTAAILPDVTCVLGAGSYVDPDVLLDEITRSGLSSDRLLIDPNAMILSEDDRLEERTGSLRESIASTESGTGAAVRRRISRTFLVRLAKHDDRLRPFVKPVVPFIRACLTAKDRVIIEGTQGFGLSLLHSDYYPYVTSRDTTAAAFVAEVGLSPLDVDDIVLVLRAFPIRVGGNSGPLPDEIQWGTVSREAGSPTPIVEYTSVTQTVRRVARFHPEIVRRAIMANTPTCLVLNHLDYIDSAYRDSHTLTGGLFNFIGKIEALIDAPINYLGFGPSSLVKRISDGIRRI